LEVVYLFSRLHHWDCTFAGIGSKDLRSMRTRIVCDQNLPIDSPLMQEVEVHYTGYITWTSWRYQTVKATAWVFLLPHGNESPRITLGTFDERDTPRLRRFTANQQEGRFLCLAGDGDGGLAKIWLHGGGVITGVLVPAGTTEPERVFWVEKDR